MNVIIAGASAGLGRVLAEEAAHRGHNLFISASDERDLAAVASDLQLRYSVEVRYAACDFGRLEDCRRFARSALAWEEIGALLLPFGASMADDTGLLDEASAQRLLNVNFFSQVCLVTKMWPRLAQNQTTHVIGFGSVAAIRGRRKNVVYGAAKRALISYFESLQQLAVGTGIRVQLYQLGYMETQQTFGKKLLFPAVSPKRVARMVFDCFGAAPFIGYYPRFWAAISVVLRILPWSVFKRLNF